MEGREVRRRGEAAGHAHYGDVVAVDRALYDRFVVLPGRCSQRHHSQGTATRPPELAARRCGAGGSDSVARAWLKIEQ